MIFLLLVIYQIKHFVCDYPLQTRYMLGKFKPYPDYVLPLLAHSAVHGAATFLIALCFKSYIVSVLLGILDMAIHFAVDRVKASPELGGRFTALSKKEMQNILSYIPTLGEDGVKEVYGNTLKSNTYFWWALGADQFAHHMTHYMLIAIILL